MRHGDAEDRKAHRAHVGGAAGIGAGDEAEREGEHDRDQQSGARQLQRRRESFGD